MKIPSNYQAERAVVGSMLIERAAYRTAEQYLTPAMFFHEDTKALFKAAVDLYQAETPVDVITIGEEIRRNSQEHKLQPHGNAAIQECINAVTTAEHAEHYSKIVAACYYERLIIQEATKIVAETYQSADGDVQALLNRIKEIVLEKESLTASMTFDYSRDLVSFYESLGVKESGATNKIGLPGIDKMWGGTRYGELNVWGAATNVGKSLMCLNLMNLIATQNRRCLYVGTEMSSSETAERHLSVVSGISASKIRSRDLDQVDLSILRDAIGDKMRPLPIKILDKPHPSLQQIERSIINNKPEVVFLDYLERFDMPNKGDDFRFRVKEFMRCIKNMAREHKVEIHLAAQLGRGTYDGNERRPTLADLSESNSVEKEADRVMLLWRPKAKQVLPGYAVLECIQAKGRQNAFGGVIDLRLSLKNLKIDECEIQEQFS